MKKLFVLPLLLLSTAASGQTISQHEALSKAHHFLNSRHEAPGHSNPQLSLAYTAAKGGETYYYVFNLSGGGFIIIGGDAAAQEVLGYSTQGSFSSEGLPENLKWWLGQYEEQISQAIRQVKSGAMHLAGTPSHAPLSSQDIQPLLGTGSNAIEWDQGNPYNLAIDGGSGLYYTGCVATAGAQVMRAYQHPASDTGIRYEQASLGIINGIERFAPSITEDYTYHWDTMLPQYNGHSYQLNDENVKDMANLMYRLGRTIEAHFTTFSTSASLRNLGEQLTLHFGYDRLLAYDRRSYYSDHQWEEKILSELLLSHPVLYGGQDIYGNGGHAFVCDGYRASDDTYHINWGWSGYCNGYFRLTGVNALTPSGSGAGGAGVNAQYTYNQEILTNVMPDQGHDYALNMLCSDYKVTESIVKKGKEVSLEGIFMNFSYQDYKGAVGVTFIDNDTYADPITVKYYNVSFSPFAGISSMKVTTPDALVSGKSYQVYPVYEEDGEWKYFHLNGDNAIPVVSIVEPDHSLKGFCTSWSIDEQLLGYGTSGKVVSGGFGNDGETANVLTFGFRFINVNDASDVAYSESFTYNLPSNSYIAASASNPVTLNVPVSLTEGDTYTVTSVYKDNDGVWQESRRIEPFADPTIVIAHPDRLILASDLTVKNLGYFTTNDLEIDFDILNDTGIDINGKTIVLWFFPSEGGSSQDYIQLTNQNLPDGQIKSYTVGYNDLHKKNLKIGKDYKIKVQNYSDSYYISDVQTPVYMRAAKTIEYSPKVGKWGTLCLPYEAELPAGMTAYTVTGFDEEGLLTKEPAEKLLINTPYLIEASEGTTYSFSGPTTPTGSYQNGLLYGSTVEHPYGSEDYVPAGAYKLMQGEEGEGFYLVQNSEEERINAYEAYLMSEVIIDGTLLRIEEKQEEDDAIEQLWSDSAPTRLYNLQGQPVTTAVSGQILINEQGRKTFMK